jgi:hypothetical protein
MSAGPAISASCATMSRRFATAFAGAGCRPPRASSRSRSRRSGEAPEPFVSKLFPCSTKVLRTQPLRAMVIGAFVRGLSMRDIESLCEKAGLGQLSKSTAQRICSELREALRGVQAPRPLRGPARGVPAFGAMSLRA